MIDNYLDILEESLQKKLQVLDRIIAYNKEQEELLKQESFSMEELDGNMQKKDQLVAELTKLDDGFEAMYDRIRDELLKEKDRHKAQIGRLQSLISEVTDKGVMITAQEARNKKHIEDYFLKERHQLRDKRKSSKAAYDYYRSMSGANVVLPQIMDQKQ